MPDPVVILFVFTVVVILGWLVIVLMTGCGLLRALCRVIRGNGDE